MRRAFALDMFKGSAAILSMSRLLGHVDLSLLQRCIRQMADDLGQVHHRAGPVDKLLVFMPLVLGVLWRKP